jgi:DNA-binding IclR family transcriptional regulator
MLASLPPQQVRALFPSREAFIQRHGVGPTTLPGLRAVLSRVRRDGFAVEDGTVTPDFASVAAAVLDHGGHPVAGIAVTYPAAEVTQDQRQAIAAQVIRTATDLSRRVGGRA